MSQTLPNGTLLNDRFRIRRLLSESPLGAVYLVDDVKITDKPWVAREYLPLPIPPNERMSTEDSFHQAVDRIKNLSHPNLVHVIDSFLEGNRTYLITEYIDGLSMDAIIHLTSNPIQESQALEWGVQICEPLEYLHGLAAPFYMRDLNPRYLLVNRDGQVKIGGYGLDLIFSRIYKIPSSCVAPELDESLTGSIAADIYSLGACLYILLTRTNPRLPVEPVGKLNPQISAATGDLIMLCLSEDPARRPASAAEVQRSFLRTLNPPKEEPPPKPRVTLGDVGRKAMAPVASALNAVMDLGAAVYARPYYLVLVAIVIAALFFTLNPFREKEGYLKTGPLTYALCSNRIVIVDSRAFIVAGKITGLRTEFVAPALKVDQIWFGSVSGQMYLVDTKSNIVEKRLAFNEPIGGAAVGPGAVVYVSMDRSNTLNIIGPNGLPVAVVPLGREPQDVVYSPGTNEIFAANAGSNSITVVDAKKFLVTRTMALQSSPSHMALSPDGVYLFVVYNNQEKLEIYAVRGMSLVNAIDIPAAGPYSLGVSETTVAVGAHGGNQIFLYQIGTWTKSGQISLDRPVSTAFSPDGKQVYACNDSGYLFDLDPSSGQIQQHIYVGKNPVYLLAIP